MDKEILTIEEAAELLKIGKRSVYKLAKKKKIPAKLILNKWRFVKEDLIKWVASGS
ncbi:MAG: helix-turn-helix domain-containing protein [Deltaproteobacteria bacterium]|nr:helix-turn-helix domain-containing protein [Deltaproteobacteria bacterium]